VRLDFFLFPDQGWGSGFRDGGIGLKVGISVWDPGIRVEVWGVGFEVRGLGFEVKGLDLEV
jgi:hypothetical protein